MAFLASKYYSIYLDGISLIPGIRHTETFTRSIFAECLYRQVHKFGSKNCPLPDGRGSVGKTGGLPIKEGTCKCLADTPPVLVPSRRPQAHRYCLRSRLGEQMILRVTDSESRRALRIGSQWKSSGRQAFEQHLVNRFVEEIESLSVLFLHQSERFADQH